MDSYQETALEMALNRAIDQQLDVVVQLAVAMAKLLEKGSMRNSQLRNLLETALHTESLEMVANFIRYQIGRGRDWGHNDFGEKMIAVIEDDGALDRVADWVSAEVKKVADEMNVGEKFKSARWHHAARIDLTRRFLGELNRAFVYADTTKRWDKLQPILKPIQIVKEEGGDA